MAMIKCPGCKEKVYFEENIDNKFNFKKNSKCSKCGYKFYNAVKDEYDKELSHITTNSYIIIGTFITFIIFALVGGENNNAENGLFIGFCLLVGMAITILAYTPKKITNLDKKAISKIIEKYRI